MLVFVQEAAETVTATDAELGELVRVGDRFRQRNEWPAVCQALVWPVRVVATRSRTL